MGLLEKFNKSGVYKENINSLVTDSEKDMLLSYIRDIDRDNVCKAKQSFVFKRKTIQQIKLFGNRKVSVEVLEKKCFVHSGVNDRLQTKYTYKDCYYEMSRISLCFVEHTSKYILQTLNNYSLLSNNYIK